MTVNASLLHGNLRERVLGEVIYLYPLGLRPKSYEAGLMQATVGDRLHVHRNTVGQPDKTGRIVEVRGSKGGPPYVVEFDDGHTGLVFPGPDAVVETPDGSRRAENVQEV